MKKYFILSAALLMGAMTFTSCSDDDKNENEETSFDLVKTTPIVDEDNYDLNTVAANYSVKSFGEAAIDNCGDLVDQLTSANAAIQQAKLSEAQETYLREVLKNLVSNVIIPTYTQLADETEKLEKTLNGLTVSTITQAQINSACEDFKEARKYWERSEAFLMGAASDFDVDPTIDSWPLNRSLLLSYFNNGMNDEMLEDATILGFHALEFILFRDGQPRKVAELQANDTYKNFENISGAKELAYAQTICTLLKQRTFQLQVAWEGEKNSSRVAVVKAAGLDYTTEAGLSYGDNLINAGIDGSKSTFPTLKAAISQILSDDEGSCVGIANEVGTAKIANPFASGDISYVESPYSYNSIADFRDNIRSIRNIWLGSTDKKANDYSFHTFFASVKSEGVNTAVENGYLKAIEAISNMPSAFVKYCSTIWGIAFEDDEDWEVEE
ncbi:Imelysin [Prevotella sp. khp7]|uniref:imelysin family protein n=1 Tax=Prevotella sp. khp7 TaxID=1761885 RepID=UPI0008CFBB69|nr:imelysin family protein [Prevotella sp. khp7]SEV87133.1 Imelysin [Prevotella sp. khp7]